jgi:divalent metal cation (Fe/Co/Zn/Cd) transporter
MGGRNHNLSGWVGGHADGVAPADLAGQARVVRRVTFSGLLVNVFLSAMKFLVGVMGASQALVADAVHSLSDTVTDVAVLIGVRYWSAPADVEHPHGHGRIQTLVSLFIGVALVAVGAGLGYNAIASLPERHDTPPSWLAFIAACISMVANAWHHRSDALSSIPVAVAVLGARLMPTWSYLDHIAAVLVCVFILQAAWSIAWPALRELIDAGAVREERVAILRLARATDGVKAVHALRTRNIGAGLQVDLHALVDPDLTVRQGHDIAADLKRRLLDAGPRVTDVLVHIEPYSLEMLARGQKPGTAGDEATPRPDAEKSGRG